MTGHEPQGERGIWAPASAHGQLRAALIDLPPDFEGEIEIEITSQTNPATPEGDEA